MKTVFITRDLAPNSLFKQKLENQGFTVLFSSLIEFSSFPFNYNFQPDWIFFYSKNGVKHFFQKTFQENFGKVKFATIGVSTANYLKEKGFEVHFVGNGNPEVTAKEFLKIAENQQVLFPRALNSKMSIQKLLKGAIGEIDLVVYKNESKLDSPIPDSDIVVFTSPLNAKLYFHQKQSTRFQSFISIGNTTAKALRQLGISNFLIAKNPSEKDLVAAVLSV